MRIGKVSNTVLQRSVMKQIKHRRDEVILPAGVGEDCGAFKVGTGENLLVSTQSITGTEQELGELAVHGVVNSLAASGAKTIGITVNILLPEQAREIVIKRVISQMEEVCSQLLIEILEVNAEVTKAVNQPLLTITGFGSCKKGELVPTKGLQAGNDLVMTKWTGLLGTARLATKHLEELTQKYTNDFISEATEFTRYSSVVEEADIAKQVGVTCMHYVAERGIYGALWDLSLAAGVGFEVELEKIPIRQETVEVCEFYDLNPYQLMAGGSLLIGTDQGNAMVKLFREAGISAEVIGKAVKGNDKIIIREGERFSLEPPKSDEFYEVSSKIKIV